MSEPTSTRVATGSMARWLGPVFSLLALIAIAYHVVSIFWTFHGAMQHYTTHFALIFSLILLELTIAWWAPASGWRRIAWMTFLAVMAVCVYVSTPYLYVKALELEMTQPFLTPLQFLIGVLLLTAVFGLNWFVWGKALTLVCLAAALYFYFGHLVPGPAADLRLSPETVLSYLAGMGGPRGVYTYIPLSADTLFLLLVYGGLMGSTKVLDMFSELGKAIGNFFRGGVAFSCVAATSMVGMVTGQTVSCIALTGSMTIPTMHRRGFRREEAGAIEVLAANGSQIIPPIMGLGAFLMAVILGVPYVEIAAAAIVPAFLYMVAVAIGVYCLVQASPTIPFEHEEVDWRKFLWVLPSFLPSIALVVALLSMHYSANMAAFWGIVVIAVLSYARPRRLRPTWQEMLAGFRNGALAGAHLALILAAIGIVVQMLVTTGLGNLFGRLMIEASGESLIVALLLGMGIALVIGMGLPTPAAYSLCAVVMIPSLIDVGVEPLVAHFYGFYFAVFSSFTPPVAVGVLMAVRISGGSFAKTVIESFKLGAVCMLLPFFMVAFPNALQFPDLTYKTIEACVLLCVSTVMLSAATYGGLTGPITRGERAFMMLGPAFTLLDYYYRDLWLAWLPPMLLVGFLIYRRVKRTARSARPRAPSTGQAE